MTFGRRPSLGLDQPLYYVQTNVSSAFKLEQSFATPVKGRRVDVCFHPKPGPGLLANTLSHIATFFGCIYIYIWIFALQRYELGNKNNQSWFCWREGTRTHISYTNT